MTSMKRAILGALIVLAAPLGATGADIQIKAGITPIIDQAQYYAAVDQGYFKQEGLDVEGVTGNNSAALLPGLTAGRLQFVSANIVTVLQGVEEGIPFRIVGPGTAMAAKPPDISPLAALKDGPIRTLKDLEGRTLAVNSLRGILWLYSRAYLESRGVDLSKVKIVELPFPNQYDALIAGRVDAVGMTEPFATRATESGKVKILGYPYTEKQANMQSVVLVTTADWAKNNTDSLNRFVRAYLKGQEYIQRHKSDPAGVKIISSYTRMDPAVVSKIVLPEFPATVSIEGIEETARLMMEYKLLKAMPDLKSIVLTVGLRR